MAACQDAGNRKPDLVFLAEDYISNLANDVVDLLAHIIAIVIDLTDQYGRRYFAPFSCQYIISAACSAGIHHFHSNTRRG